MAHRCSIDVRFNELDPYNHVNHANYVTYLEVGRSEALRWCGIPLESLTERGVQIFITSLKIDYKAPAGAGDRLVVETTQAEQTQRVSTEWQQRIICDDRLLATATVVGVSVNLDGRPIRRPDWLTDALSRLSDEETSPEQAAGR